MTSKGSLGGIRRITIALGLLLAVLSATALSQDIFQNRLRMALDKVERLTMSGKYDDALELLTDLDKEYPQDAMIYEAFRKAYAYSGDYDNALEMLKKMEGLFGRSTSLMLQYGDLYLKMGDNNGAAGAFERALEISGQSLNTFHGIANVYRSNGLYDEAVEVYRDARRKLNQPSLLSRELGQLYEVQRNYTAAIREYYIFMMSDSSSEGQGNQLIRKVIEYLDDPNDLNLLKSTFADIGKSEPNSHVPKRFLGDILIRQDSLDRAYELYKEVDKLENDHGKFLVYFARRCLEQDHDYLASDACRYVLDEYPNEAYYIQAKYVLASAYVKLGQGDSAITVVREIAETARDHRSIIESMYFIGTVFLDILNQPDSALAYFDAVTRDAQFLGWRNRASLRKADCYLVKGYLAAADSIYRGVDETSLGDGENESLAWQLAQVKFFEHDFEEAKRLYAGLTIKHRKGLFVNDCLKRILMIDENSGLDQFDLASFADAEYLILRADLDSAITRLEFLSDKTGSNLADIATFRMGELYLRTGEIERALLTYQKLLAQFPESFWRGESQKHIADIHWDRGETQLAQQAYRSLLTEYDNLLLQEHARQRLMQLENM
ncbi:MAG: tetratricopeptide repeat protein [candidate division Zixibacteria bacterium]|nr:tetratricopeptide repeat protein [candidate division Zixibacteria bacterium]MBU1471333.1 tetratricopeptide repeat protein [candidate division Zixibacteria bacterium]MBU2626777.1 tetratricopeptide repeat protein [candidate division Zixibacteria bacterium]